jgi:hypothetical protein
MTGKMNKQKDGQMSRQMANWMDEWMYRTASLFGIRFVHQVKKHT